MRKGNRFGGIDGDWKGFRNWCIRKNRQNTRKEIQENLNTLDES
jgi:hypothetical protein